MNKQTFLEELYHLLKPLSNTERQQHIDYYGEMIDDRVEDGLSEEDAVAALGRAADIAAQILGDLPPKNARKYPVWAIVLIALGSPLWISLLLAAVAVMVSIVISLVAVYISVFLSLWAILAGLYAAVLGLFIGFLAAIGGGIYLLFQSIPLPGVALLGAGLICSGCAVLLFLLCNLLARLLWRLSKWSMLKIAGIFRRKGGKQ